MNKIYKRIKRWFLEPYEFCSDCGCLVRDDKWVCNWGSCDGCFNYMLDKDSYLFEDCIFGEEYLPCF